MAGPRRERHHFQGWRFSGSLRGISHLDGLSFAEPGAVMIPKMSVVRSSPMGRAQRNPSDMVAAIMRPARFPGPTLLRQLHLEDRKRARARQVVLEGDFPKMRIGEVEIATSDHKAVGPGKFGGVADEDL